MPKIILVDLGASRIKSALADLRTGTITLERSQPSLPPLGAAGTFEVPAGLLVRKFREICSSYAEEARGGVEGVVLCSEMHGFAVAGPDGRFKTGYISWKDARGLAALKGVSALDLVSRGLGAGFRAATGMTLRPGLPYVNAFHLARARVLRTGDRILSLPELLTYRGGRPAGAHETMTAGLGFYDIYRGGTSARLADFFRRETGVSPELAEPAGTGACGFVRCGDRELPVFPGLGDHQCAVLGAGNGPDTVSVNMGTGSQVSILSRKREPRRNQQRPFFDGYLLSTITHIPGGRALNEFTGFLRSTGELFGAGRPDVWKVLAGISRAEAEASTLNFDLGIFPGAWGGTGAGAVGGMTEGSLTPRNYLASLLRSFAAQYCAAVAELRPPAGRPALLSGGVSQRLPQLAGLIAGGTGRRTRISAEREETFAGLRAAAAVYSGRSDSFIKAVKKYRQWRKRK
ncbi:MAG: hypothetical protein M0025_04830 [Elusimicrobia bacterium]|nr:hypothetical protein [Elusimicrobiota bacterium]